MDEGCGKTAGRYDGTKEENSPLVARGSFLSVCAAGGSV
jgi:hypothetical protein